MTPEEADIGEPPLERNASVEAAAYCSQGVPALAGSTTVPAELLQTPADNATNACVGSTPPTITLCSAEPGPGVVDPAI